MEFVKALRRLWRHQLFRRLVAVRIAVQATDGMVQVGMAAYLLLDPRFQTTGADIVAVMAIMFLPFSVVGPFVSGVLDRWNRRQAVIVTDVIRIGLSLGMAALVVVGTGTALTLGLFYLAALLTMSLNRFALAGMSAALAHTVDEDEYLLASSVMPTVGPAGVVIGGGAAFAIRALVGPWQGTQAADALVFVVCAAGFALTVVLALRIPRDALGPDATLRLAARRTSVRAEVVGVVTGLADAVRHIVERRPAALGLLTIALQRIGYGMVMVAAILVYRNTFYDVADVDAATAAFGLWAGATAVGFVLSGAVTPFFVARIGLRRWIVTVLVAAGVLQVVPGSIITQPTLVVAGFLLGVAAQSLKIGVDTLVQAHVDEAYKGRVFVVYDMIFNTTQVGAAVLAAALLPASGVSVPVYVGIGVWILAVAVLFARSSARIGPALFEKGTEDLLGTPATDPAPDVARR
ncbi:MFS transporter [Desertihabitans aurantiacus]|uniref:MFS transporter n=1 Tax=Desertihabitans aurantiacus TaxID=2282477 RepID=UPI000DF7B235|nr:MFS transporter [Desertihabitans aurantiacus]